MVAFICFNTIKKKHKIMIKKKVKISYVNDTLDKLSKFEDKNPIAFEISRTLKSLNECSKVYINKRDEICNEFLLRDDKGQFIVLDSVQKQLDSIKAANPDSTPVATIHGFEIQPDKSRDDYNKALDELLVEEVEINIFPVDAKAKIIAREGEKKPLIEIISDVFKTTEILLLEEIGILINME